ncbi:site-specific integrase [Chitinophaga sp. S165]|uniref:site-specific integrase n=1 Tax=Chitinophaga sp. S165 TaxID=2135462 RepID=UPI000D71AFA9|nr:site-specific integrase [Chitinophaga sp. S165]PWV45920.1 site-specific recombinase XerD [Chitinophaga sp. S165]
MNILERPNRKGDKITFYYDYGRGRGQRPSTGIFVYTRPKNQTEKNHNKQARDLLEVKKSHLIIEQQAIGTGFIPAHKFKANFLEYFEEYVRLNKRDGNRHLANSLVQFKEFIACDFISPVDVTENLCKRFRQFLLDKFTGETPANYYARLKWVLKAATSDGYYRVNPTEKINSKSNPSIQLKENLEVEEYLALLNTPCLNEEIREAFVFCCYTGLRWVDVDCLFNDHIKEGILTTRIIQAKTGQPVTLTLHPIAQAIVAKQRKKKGNLSSNTKLFQIPGRNGCNKTLEKWVKSADIKKHITWSCARLSFSILLQDKNVDDATVAALLGHTTTTQVRKVYKRHRPKDQTETISKLPSPNISQYFLHLPEGVKEE